MMDPDATLERLMAAYVEQDWGTMAEAAGDLLEWCRKGGFMAKLSPSQLRVFLDLSRNYARYNAATVSADRVNAR